jgi:hypothetical protein
VMTDQRFSLPNSIFGLVTPDEMTPFVRGAKWLCIDFETTGLERDAGILGFAVCSDKGAGYVDWRGSFLPPHELVDALRWASANIPVIGWNLKFDLHLLYRLTGVEVRHPIGVDVGLWLLNENAALGLKENLGVITGTDWPTFKDYLKRAYELLKAATDAERESWVADFRSNGYTRKTDARRDVATRFPYQRAVPADITLSELAPYCVRDVLATTLAWLRYVRPALEADGQLDYFYSYEMPFLRTLWRCEHRGIAVDPAVLLELATEAFGTTESIAAEIRAIAERDDFNPNSNDHLKWLLFDKLGLEVGDRRTKSGEISLDEKSIKDLIEAYPETDLLDLILKYRDAKKIHGTYADALPKLLDADNRLHTRYVQTGTVTGRLSSADPNLQNIPKDKKVRRAFVARKGYVFVEADLSQAELRVLADRTGDPKLRKVYEDDRDIHQSTMDLVGIEERRVAKIVNFLMVYGGGPKVLRTTYAILRALRRPSRNVRR